MNQPAVGTANKKSAIIRAALKVFAAHGFDAGTIREIAVEASVAEGLIYHYFDSKEALLDAVIRERSIIPWLDEPEALPDDLSVEDALRQLITEALDRLSRNADLFAVVWSQVATNRRLADRVGRIVRDVTGRIAAYLDRKIARGELRPIDTNIAARLVAGSLVTFTIMQHRLSPPLKYIEPDHFADQITDILITGCRIDASSTKGQRGRRRHGKTAETE